MNAWGILLIGVAAPFVAGVYWKTANTAGAWVGVLFGTVSWILLSFLLPENSPTHLFGFTISCVALILISLLTGRFQHHGNPQGTGCFRQPIP